MGLERFDCFFQPGPVALVGAGGQEGTVGRVLAANLAAEFAGPLHFVNAGCVNNAGGGTLFGRPVLAEIARIEGPVDLGVVAVPAGSVSEVLARLGEKGARGAIIVSSGLGAGPGSLAEQAIATARRYGMRLIGPNSLGVLSPPRGVNASFAHMQALKGDLALISQSGAIVTSVLERASQLGIGFSAMVALGESADVHFPEMIDYFALDHRTRAILLYVEHIADARSFMSAARAAARTKPVVVIKSGRHSIAPRAAACHTGALASPDAIYDAAFRRAGLLRVTSLEQLFSAAETLSLVPRSRGRRLAIVTNGGGLAMLAVDDLVDQGGTLAALSPETLEALQGFLPEQWSGTNPVDILDDAGAERYERTMASILADPANDCVIAINSPTAFGAPAPSAEALVRAVKEHRRKTHRPKPVLACWPGGGAEIEKQFSAARIPSMRSPQAAVDGIMDLLRYTEAQEALAATPPDVWAEFQPDRTRARAAIARALSDGRDWLMQTEVAAVLEAYDIHAAPVVPADGAGEARLVAEGLFRHHRALVVKIASPDIVHKSEVGGVELGLTTVEAVTNAAERILASARAAVPDARIDGLTIHPMVFAPKAVELIAGVADDPVFGPVIVFGRGGTAVEVINDKALALPPLDMNLAQDLISRTRVARQIAGYRDRKPVDREKLGLLLVKLSQLVADIPEIREIDLNPVLAQEDRLIVVDARMSVRAETSLAGGSARYSGHPRLAIRPYPSEWESEFRLKSGRMATIRPIRPEDERYYPAFFRAMTDEDMHLRFFSRARELGHAFIARLTQIDYGRAMAFIAIDPATDEMLGAVRLHGDPDGYSGEYGIAIRSDLKGEGLGWALMRLIIRFAGRENYQWIRGEVLRANRAMLAMCRALGFEVHAEPDDMEVMNVRLNVPEVVGKDPTLK